MCLMSAIQHKILKLLYSEKLMYELSFAVSHALLKLKFVFLVKSEMKVKQSFKFWFFKKKAKKFIQFQNCDEKNWILELNIVHMEKLFGHMKCSKWLSETFHDVHGPLGSRRNNFSPENEDSRQLEFSLFLRISLNIASTRWKCITQNQILLM